MLNLDGLCSNLIFYVSVHHSIAGCWVRHCTGIVSGEEPSDWTIFAALSFIFKTSLYENLTLCFQIHVIWYFSWLQILYGLDLSMSQTQFSKIHQLAEFLGITMDIKHGESVTSESAWASEQSSVLAKPQSKLPEKSLNEPILPKAPAKTTRKTLARIAPKTAANTERKVPNTPQQPPILVSNVVPSPNKVPNLAPAIPSSLPICCWHCNQSFPHLDDLQKHLKTHKGEQTKSSTKHKCQKCKKVSLAPTR